MYVQRTIEELSRYHCCSEKAMCYIFCVCVCVCVCSLSYPACNAHGPYYMVICGLYDCTIFFQISSQVSEKKSLNIQCVCVLIFSTTYCEGRNFYTSKKTSISM
jgi:hypothetical protein